MERPETISALATAHAAAREALRGARAVAALPERLRTVYELHAKGFTNVKISGEVGCSKGEVSKRLNAARETLGLPTTKKAC